MPAQHDAPLLFTAQLSLSDCVIICTQKERRLLENLRLDLDACKARLKKAKQAEAKAAVSHFLCSFQSPTPLFLILVIDSTDIICD